MKAKAARTSVAYLYIVIFFFEGSFLFSIKIVIIHVYCYVRHCSHASNARDSPLLAKLCTYIILSVRPVHLVFHTSYTYTYIIQRDHSSNVSQRKLKSLLFPMDTMFRILWSVNYLFPTLEIDKIELRTYMWQPTKNKEYPFQLN